MANEIKISAEAANDLRAAANERIKLYHAVERLKANPDFKQLYTTYTEKEALRYVGLLADPTLNMGEKAKFRDDISECLNAIARFKFFVEVTLSQWANQAEKTLDDLNNASVE